MPGAKATISVARWRRMQAALREALGQDTHVVSQVAAVLCLDDTRKTSQMSKTRWAAIERVVRASAPEDAAAAACLDALREILEYDETASTYTPQQARASKDWIQRKTRETGLSAYVVSGEQRRRQEATALRAAFKAGALSRVQEP